MEGVAAAAIAGNSIRPRTISLMPGKWSFIPSLLEDWFASIDLAQARG
jgi:hypothetical protein